LTYAAAVTPKADPKTDGTSVSPPTLFQSSPHGSYVFVQACIAILILVGFSQSLMGEERKTKTVSRARYSCHSSFKEHSATLRYFGANFSSQQAATMPTAWLHRLHGDMMQLWNLFWTPAGWWFMFIRSAPCCTHRTTLACMNTGANAMGRDDELAGNLERSTRILLRTSRFGHFLVSCSSSSGSFLTSAVGPLMRYDQVFHLLIAVSSRMTRGQYRRAPSSHS
jgi:hypothetical protein